MKWKVFFRVDASNEIGLGHLIRCFAFAKMIDDIFDIIFFCKSIPDALINEFTQANYLVYKISSDDEFINLLQPSTLVILDGYDFDMQFQKKIKNICSNLIIIDDLYDNEYCADLLINHTPGVEVSDYINSSCKNFALGLNYVLLRPAFLRPIPQITKKNGTNTLMICFGGSDIKNLTHKVLNIVIESFNFNKIIVVTGAEYQYMSILKDFVISDSRIFHLHAINDEFMVKAMDEADVLVIPASGILFEALSRKKKIVSGKYVENQKYVYSRFLEMSAIFGAGDFSFNEIVSALKRALQNSNKEISLFDGLSPYRLRKLLFESFCILRQVNINDATFLFDLANEQEVRGNSISKAFFSFESHLKWFSEKLNSPNTKIYILTLFNVSIGQIRYDYLHNEWKISYSVIKQLRGKGFGGLIIKKTIYNFKNVTVSADVKVNNFSSIHIFKKLGFVKMGKFLSNHEFYYNFKLKV